MGEALVYECSTILTLWNYLPGYSSGVDGGDCQDFDALISKHSGSANECELFLHSLGSKIAIQRR